jgi:hypothetical protein
MYFLDIKIPYLYDLKSFDPELGINTDDHGKYPFFCYGERTQDKNFITYEVFERDYKTPLTLRSFVTYNVDGEVCKCSEPNLNAIFSVYRPAKILVNHSYPIKEEQKLELQRNLCAGYREGIKHPLINEIGILFYKEGMN